MALFMGADEAVEAWKDAGEDPDLLGMKSMMEEPPEETAELLKEQGNLSLKKGKKFYREALQYYTEAIECESSIAVNNSVYYGNRAQVHLLLRNYGHALSDSQAALKLNPANVKAYFRAAKAAYATRSFTAAADYCREGLGHDPENEELKKILKEAEEKMAEESAHVQRAAEIVAEAEALVDALSQRKLRMGRALFKEHTGGRRVWLDGSGLLHWPVLLLYGEVMSSDFIEDFCETDLFVNHIDAMFAEDSPMLQWDERHEYSHGTIELYYQTNAVPALKRKLLLPALMENHAGVSQIGREEETVEDDEEDVDWSDAGEKRWVKVDRRTTLGSVLAQPGHVVPGTPVFYVVAKGTAFRRTFLAGSWSPP